MQTFQNLTVLGTSHISQQSINEVTLAVENIQPKIIAIELDALRLQSLLSKKQKKLHFSDVTKIGVKGYLFALIGQYLQKKLGKIVKVTPGSEMIQAVKLAKKHNLKLALVDQPINITLKRFSQEFTWKEKFRFLGDIFRGIFFKKKQIEKYQLQNFDLTKVPEEKIIKKLIQDLKKRYPSLYQVLIKERNQFIAKNLVKLLQKNPQDKILAVVGAGHELDLIKLIQKDYKPSFPIN